MTHFAHRASCEIARAARALPLFVALGALACDFKVTNPGPVPSENLESRSTAAGIVNGAGRDLSDALNWIAYTSGAISREVFPAGSTGSFGISAQQQIGKLLDDDTNNY